MKRKRDPRLPSPSQTAGSYHILTWGCQMNVHDSEKLSGELEARGYRRAAQLRDADVILLNTCAVREKAAEKVFSEIGRLGALKKRNPGLVIGVCGCVAQQEGDAIYARAPVVDLVVGPRATGTIPEVLARLRSGDASARGTTDTAYRDDSVRVPYDRIRRETLSAAKAYVTIIEGCNHRCTFCIVPRTRGREISRDMDSILEETRDLASRGVVEVEFLGQTVNAYRDASSRSLADLLEAACDIDGIERIRFTTSHPAQMTPRLIEAMGALQPKVCPYLHLPVQSGSSRILRAMRRGYDRAGYLRRVESLRRRIPGLSLGTDFIVGFPGEEESDYLETLSLLDAVEFDTVYSFVYSPRPGTAALDVADATPEATKLERLARLQARQRSIQETRNRSWIDREVDVLVEGPSKKSPSEWTGRTPENRIVNFAGETAPGRLEKVRITASFAHSLRGALARRDA